MSAGALCILVAALRYPPPRSAGGVARRLLARSPCGAWLVCCVRLCLLGLRPRADVAAVARSLRGAPSLLGRAAPAPAARLPPRSGSGRAVALSRRRSSLRAASFRLSPRAFGVSPRLTRSPSVRSRSPLPTSALGGPRGAPRSPARSVRGWRDDSAPPAAPLRALPPPSFAWARYALNPTLRRPSLGDKSLRHYRAPLSRLAYLGFGRGALPRVPKRPAAHYVLGALRATGER